MSAPDDRAAVKEVIDRYFAAIDRSDPVMLRSCFADDAIYRSDAGRLDMDGGDMIGSRLAQGGRYAFTSHLRGSQVLHFVNAACEADTFAVAYLVDRPGPDGMVIVRGIRYRDRLERRGDRWKIVSRLHSSQWQYEVAGAPVMPI